VYAAKTYLEEVFHQAILSLVNAKKKNIYFDQKLLIGIVLVLIVNIL
jgi:hypothetical protein